MSIVSTSADAELLMAVDQGTTGTTVLVLNSKFNLLSRVNTEFAQIYPRPGWVEHSPQAIWDSTVSTMNEALKQAGAGSDKLKAIGITNQRETTVIWDRKTGIPIHNAIVWQCRRTANRCDQLRHDGHAALIQKKTGLVLDAYFSGTKVAWILKHVEGARRRAQAGELAFGTIDTYLLWRLTDGAAHATEVSNASRTLLMDLETGQWDPGLCEIIGVPEPILPVIQPSNSRFGETRNVPGFPDGIPISGILGDQQAALFGQCCFEPGEAKCTFGTGAFLLMNIGDASLASQHKLLTTAAWQIDDQITYAFEGSAFIAGAAVQWLRDGLNVIDSAADVERIASEVPDTQGVVFVPALTGLGAPHWNPDARALLWGMTRGTTAAHVARAVLEGIAFQNYDILQAMQADLSDPLRSLKVDGGASANNLLMQFQSDVLNVPLIRPQVLDTTALGAAMMAGIGAGLFSDVAELRQAWREDRRFEPDMTSAARDVALERWQQGLARV